MFMKSTNRNVCCDVVFFNINNRVLKIVIDLIYGNEISFPLKDKNRVTYLLSKLGIKWRDVAEINVGNEPGLFCFVLSDFIEK